MSGILPKRLPGKTWQHFIVLLLVCIVVGRFIPEFFSSEDLEPRFRGRTLHSWVSDLRRPNATSMEKQIAEDAIQAMGTNVIPGILVTMDRPDQSALQPIYKFGIRLGLLKKMPANIEWSDDWYIRNLSKQIAPEARPYVLEALFDAYTQCYDQHGVSEHRRGNLRRAIQRFDGFSLEFLRYQMTNSNPRVRGANASLTTYARNTDEELIPILKWMLADDIDTVRFHALGTLGSYHTSREPRTSEIVPLLQIGLDDPVRYVRSFAAINLSLWGWRAEAAVPRLIELVRIEGAKTTGVRDTGFMNALRSIDPKEAEKLKASFSKSGHYSPQE